MKTFTSDEVAEDVSAAIEALLQVPLEEIVPGALFMDDLGADSLDVVELAMQLEEVFDVEIRDEAVLADMTVKQITEFVEKKVGLR